MLNLNKEEPLVMHVDLNSAFASIEQQSRPMLRGKPVAIVNRRTENTAIVTASYEAKARGIRVGMRFKEAAKLAPDLVGLESDPDKYRYVYKKLTKILSDYSSNFVMKSIDEGVIDFHGVPLSKTMEQVGLEIKQRLKNEVGSYIKCNVGIGPNRWLAKIAANLNKPDGLDIVDHKNLIEVMSTLKLTDLTGIASRNEARLNSVGIYTPLEFLNASEAVLKVVFKDVVGRDWFKRLRGWEVDDRISEMKQVGRQYVLEDRNISRDQIVDRLHNLCESVGYRMRKHGRVARGVYVYARSLEGSYWHASKLMGLPFYSNGAIFKIASDLFKNAPENIREIGIHCYELSVDQNTQISFFEVENIAEHNLTDSVDKVNNKYGYGTINSASTSNLNQIIKQKVPFGNTRNL